MEKFDDTQLGADEERHRYQRGAHAQPRYFKMTSRTLLLFLLLMVGIVFAIINFILFTFTENKDDIPTTSKRVVVEFVHRGVFDDDKIHSLMKSYAGLMPNIARHRYEPIHQSSWFVRPADPEWMITRIGLGWRGRATRRR